MKKNTILKVLSLLALVTILTLFARSYLYKKQKNLDLDVAHKYIQQIYDSYKDRAIFLQEKIYLIPEKERALFVSQSNYRLIEVSLSYTKNIEPTLSTKNQFLEFEKHQEKITNYIANNLMTLQNKLPTENLILSLEKLEKKILSHRQSYLDQIKLINKKYNTRFPPFLADLRAQPEK